MTTIHHGDCIETMNAMPPESVDAIVTDPPYGLGFMGKKWDDLPPSLEWAEACYRVLKPGGHIAAFGGTRTWHRLAVAIEDAGFEMRDSLAWIFGSGFPKSHNVSKAIDKLAGAKREVIGKVAQPAGNKPGGASLNMSVAGMPDSADITAPATPDAERWQGWGTALKPGHEPVCIAVKPYGVTDLLDEIGSHITRLEDECRPPANGATRSSAPTPADSQEARADTAPESAATPHEGEQARTTPTGAAAGSSAATDTSAFESEGETCWSTVTSWRACWGELCDLTSTSITSTESSLTTDLRTLWSSIASLTVTSIPDSPTPRLTSSSTASAVDSLFAATVLRLRATLALSATESATASMPHVPQAAGGSSAFEPIVLARKPLAEKTVAKNVLAYGTGAINIDATRIGRAEGDRTKYGRGHDLPHANTTASLGKFAKVTAYEPDAGGRWPANVLLDQHAAAWVDEQSGELKGRVGMTQHGSGTNAVYGDYARSEQSTVIDGTPDSGGASRFFYTAKAPKSERPNVDGVRHPTVKPLAIMRWLIRMVTPPGGTVLDPFAGSGTTIEAALIEGFDPVGIELEADYLPLIQHRIDRQAGAPTV